MYINLRSVWRGLETQKENCLFWKMNKIFKPKFNENSNSFAQNPL